MGFGRLTAAQRSLVAAWLPRATVIDDLSWDLVGTVVLRVRAGGRELIVKAGVPTDNHVGREIDAHVGGYTAPWVSMGRAASLRHHDRAERIIVADYLPGALCLGTPAALDPAVHRRAGELLRIFHAQATRSSAGADASETRRALAQLDTAHRIRPNVEVRVRRALAAIPPVEVPLVPTHGDWHPRNWLVDGDLLKVIDFGRFAFRPASSDFVRLAAQEWRANPECEVAFFEGYGSDPRESAHWGLLRLREAVGTAVWAHHVGDEAFEAQGHRMLDDALDGLDGLDGLDQ